MASSVGFESNAGFKVRRRTAPRRPSPGRGDEPPQRVPRDPPRHRPVATCSASGACRYGPRPPGGAPRLQVRHPRGLPCAARLHQCGRTAQRGRPPDRPLRAVTADRLAIADQPAFVDNRRKIVDVGDVADLRLAGRWAHDHRPCGRPEHGHLPAGGPPVETCPAGAGAAGWNPDRCRLARISHQIAKRGRGDAGSDKANASQGAQYLTVRRAPWPRSTQSMPVAPRPQP